MFHVTGAYIYVDPDGNPTGVEDVFTKIAHARQPPRGPSASACRLRQPFHPREDNPTPTDRVDLRLPM